MEQKILKRSVFFAIVTMVVLLIVLTTSTYAWFTSNNLASTGRVEAETGSMDVKLLLSSKGGAEFKGGETADIVQINKIDAEKLIPVSTDDLENFVYQVGSDKDTTYVLDKDGEKYYYGHIYVKAVGDGLPDGAQMAVYLDGSKLDKIANPDKDSLVNNAARLGLKMEGESGVIFLLSDKENEKKDQIRNSYLDKKLLEDGYVIHSDSKGNVSAAKDPAVELKKYSTAASNPKPIAVLDFDKIYELKIWLYVEGCDPDCSESISADASDLYLYFYGAVVE